jgi:hypothetical protein
MNNVSLISAIFMTVQFSKQYFGTGMDKKKIQQTSNLN